jgi:nitrous oxide reductase accessory protein NosL
MKRTIVAAVLAAAAGLWMGCTSALAAGTHEMQISKGAACEVCGMYIEEFRKTAVEIAFDDGTTKHACGVACGLRMIKEHGGMSHVKSAYATDWSTQTSVPLEQAALVAGSDTTPDMTPSLIAFNSKESASSFQREHGGKTIMPDEAMDDISYVGMTMPFRITPAPTPPQGLFSVGVSASYMLKDDLQHGTDDASLQDALVARPMAPKEMESTMSSLMLAYALTDDIYSDLMIPYCWKRMVMETRAGAETTDKEDGFGDVLLSGRWRFYHDAMSDRHLAAVGRVSLPSGDFDNKYRARPGMQLGTEAFGLGGGLLFSQHIGLFWLNCSAEYRYNFENTDDYKFGDVLSGGVALHFVPSTKTMLGVEVDANRTWENEDNGSDQVNTGSKSVFGNLVAQRRIATFWGGNFDVRALAGVPLYQDVEDIQLVENYHLAAGVQWKRRY